MAETPGVWLDSRPCLLDWRGQVEGFIDRYLPMEWVQPAPNVNRRLEAASRLPIPQYREGQPLKINQAYWPTGAIRWGYGFLMMHEDNVKVLKTKQTVKLKFSSETTAIETDVYILDPHPINAYEEKGSDEDSHVRGKCYLVPFVDKRFWWQFKDVDLGDGSDEDTTWQDLIDKCQTALGEPQIILNNPIESEYLKPDDLLLRYWDNAAAALEGIAHSTGRRVVVKWDGRVFLERWEDAETQMTENWDRVKEASFAAGGSTGLHAENKAYIDQVRVLFRKAVNLTPADPPDFYESAVDINTSDETVPQTAYLVRSLAWADYDAEDDPEPNNKTELDDLAGKLAADIDGWTNYYQSQCYNGVALWEPCGYDDYQIHSYGREEKKVSLFDPLTHEEPVQLREEWGRVVLIRQVFLPINTYAKTQGSKAADVKEVTGASIVVKPDAAIAARDGTTVTSGTGSIWKRDDPDNPNTIIDDDTDETIWNLLNEDLDPEKHYMASKDIFGDYWVYSYVFDFYDCPEPPAESISDPV